MPDYCTEWLKVQTFNTASKYGPSVIVLIFNFLALPILWLFTVQSRLKSQDKQTFMQFLQIFVLWFINTGVLLVFF